jgi:hypothetical protein
MTRKVKLEGKETAGDYRERVDHCHIILPGLGGELFAGGDNLGSGSELKRKGLQARIQTKMNGEERREDRVPLPRHPPKLPDRTVCTWW